MEKVWLSMATIKELYHIARFEVSLCSTTIPKNEMSGPIQGGLAYAPLHAPRGALGFGLTFPNPKRALGAHGVPHWGSSAPAHHTHPLAMQPAGGAHASSSSNVGGRGRGGREVHLCGAPSGLLLPSFREWKYLQMCSGGGGGGAGGEGSRRYSIGNTIYTFALVGR